MVSGRRLAATRLDLLRARKELHRVRHGALLVRRKREALVAELFRTARPALDLRDRIVTAVTEATQALIDAFSVHGHRGLLAMSNPPRAIDLDLKAATVWGIPVADVTRQEPLARTLGARGTDPALTGPTAAGTASRFEQLADLLIEAAPREQRLRRLGDAVSRTTRQMRTLEQRVAPSLEAQITRVRRQLEEREREDRLRLRRFTTTGGGRRGITKCPVVEP